MDPLLAPPTEILVLNGDQCRDLIDLSELRAALAEAMRLHSEGLSSVPPRIVALAETGMLAAMPGNLTGVGLASKLVSVFPGNHGGPIPSHQGVIALFDQSNGAPLALLDAAYITAIRTAGAAAVATDLAARHDARSLAIIGAGVQGHAHARMFASIRDWDDIRVASRSGDHAEALVAATPDSRVVASFEEAVRGADVVALCTDSRNPVIERDWVGEGAHVSSVGTGHEIDPFTIEAADHILVEWRGAAEHPPPTGAAELQQVDAATLVEIGDVLGGWVRARSDDADLTIYKSTGHAVQDVATARLVYDRALDQGVGTRVIV